MKIFIENTKVLPKLGFQDRSIKSISDSGEISGYASVFDIVDGCNDVVKKNAFARVVEKFNRGHKPKLLWQHDATCPIGVIDDLYEDDHGLFIRCHLLLDIPKAQEIYSLIKNKAIDGFSIGYKIKDSFKEGGITYISDVDLFEISIVTFPACFQAVISDVKNLDNSEDQYDPDDSRDFGDSVVCLEQIKALSNKLKYIIERRII